MIKICQRNHWNITWTKQNWEKNYTHLKHYNYKSENKWSTFDERKLSIKLIKVI